MFQLLILFLLLTTQSIAKPANTQSSSNFTQAMQDALSLQHQGLHTRALSILLQARSQVEKKLVKGASVVDIATYAQLISQLGDLYLQLHQWEQAAIFLSESVVLARDSNNAALLASTLNNYGNLVSIAGEDGYAHAAFDESIELSQNMTGGDQLLLTARLNKTRLLWERGESQAARDLLQQTLKNPGNSTLQAEALLPLTRLMHEMRLPSREYGRSLQPEQVRQLFLQEYKLLQQVVKLAEKGDSFTTKSQAYGYIAALYEEDGDIAEALRLTRQAIFFAQQNANSELLYTWQWQQGRLLMQQSKRSDAIRAYRQSAAILAPIRMSMLQGQRQLKSPFSARIKPVYIELADALLQQAAVTASTQKKQALLHEARNSIESMKTAEMQDYFNSECVDPSSSQQVALSNLDTQTAIIYPIMLPDRLVLLLSIQGTISQWSVDVSHEALNEQVLRFRQHLQTRSNNLFLHDAKQLYQWLLEPLEKQLKQANIDTLIFVPGGVLRMIPMAALHDGQHFLIESFAIAITPGLALTSPQAMDKSNTKALVLGLSQATQNFPPLPSVKREVAQVSSLFPSDSLLDEQFTEAKLEAMLSSKEYTLLHLATHGVFEGTPESSYLLTYNEKLNMNRLQELVGLSKYNRQPLELLTMSACQTAMGNERAALGVGWYCD